MPATRSPLALLCVLAVWLLVSATTSRTIDPPGDSPFEGSWAFAAAPTIDTGDRVGATGETVASLATQVAWDRLAMAMRGPSASSEPSRADSPSELVILFPGPKTPLVRLGEASFTPNGSREPVYLRKQTLLC